MKRENRKYIINLVYGAAIAGIYIALTMLFLPISFGPIQFRISEALCVLPIFTFSAVPGLFVGCLLANLFGGAALLDVIFGSLATLIGAYGTYLFRKNKLLAMLSPILANTIIIPFVIKYAYGAEDIIPFMMLTVFIGEVLAIGILGNLLRIGLEKQRKNIFDKYLGNINE